jgi:hypothetical protein
MEEDKAFDPTDVSLPGPQTVVPRPDGLTDLVKEFGFARFGSTSDLSATMERLILSREARVLNARPSWQKPYMKVVPIRGPSDRFLKHTRPFQSVWGMEGIRFVGGKARRTMALGRASAA